MEYLLPHRVEREVLNLQQRTGIEAALGESVSSERLSLTGSPMADSIFRALVARVQGLPSGSEAVSPDADIEGKFSGAWTTGTYLRPPKPDFQKGLPLKSGVIPESTLRPNDTDTQLLLGQRDSFNPKSLSVPFRLFLETEDIARKGLQACSALDTLSEGVLAALRRPPMEGEAQGSVFLREDIDVDSLVALLRSSSQHLKYATRLFSTIYLNQVLLHRDAFLEQSAIPHSRSRAALRTQLPTEGSLFGPAAHQALRKQVDLNRDALMLRGPSSARPRAPPSSSSSPRQPPTARRNHDRPQGKRPASQEQQPFRGGTTQRRKGSAQGPAKKPRPSSGNRGKNSRFP